MAARRRVETSAGQIAVALWLAGDHSHENVATAVRYTLEELAVEAPGNALEVRVPPHGVTQCLEGPRHTRGTPPGVVETDAQTWLELAAGSLSWEEAVAENRVIASGERADLSHVLPLPRIGVDPV